MAGIVDQWGNAVRSYRFLDAAEISDRRPAFPVRTEGILQAVNTLDWRVVLYASRRLFANMGIARGAIKQKASFAVGRAWQPIFQGADKDWGNLAAEWLRDIWYPMCEVRGGAFDFATTLGVDSVAIDRDGGYGVLLTETEDGFPQTQRIPIHRFGGRFDGYQQTITDGAYKGCMLYQGIIYSPGGVRPVAYRVHTDATGPFQAPDNSYEDISARDLIHVYEPEWYDQGHGFPAFTHAINQLRDAKTAQEWEQLAMLTASETALAIHTETGELDPSNPELMLGRDQGVTDAEQNMATQALEGGRIRVFKAGLGEKIEFPASTRPGPDWENFNDRMIRDALYGINWPYSMAWKSDGGGTDKRDDISQARQSVGCRQDILRPVAKRIVGYAISKAIKRGDLPEYKGGDLGGQLKWSFQMPARMTIDDGRTMTAKIEAAKYGIMNQEEIWSEGGGNWIEGRIQREEEADDLITRAKRLSDKHGIVLDQALMLMQQNTPNQQSIQGEADDGSKPPAKPVPNDE